VSHPEKLRSGLSLAGLFLISFLFVPAHANGYPETVLIAAGQFISGSDNAEREAAYWLDEAAYGHSITRKNGWYDDEAARHTASLPEFRITRTLITNGEYAKFVQATGHRYPTVSAKEWSSYGLVHPFGRTQKFSWVDDEAPRGREQHPVVLVSYDDARAYAVWLSSTTGKPWRLPTELEWEKAARGTDGRRFPWGNQFVPELLNSHDTGPFDTTPVGSLPGGKSPYGLLDAAGQVFEWTQTRVGKNRYRVKGGSWDDKGCGVCRPAARHSRPVTLKHILIGFRLVQAPLTVK
jgi:formylglycine-generating enzyme required for sulfatase activity